MDRKGWIRSLKPGDKVANYERDGLGGSCMYVIYEVKNLTPKGRVRLTNGDLLNEEGRGCTGDRWNSKTYNIQPLTEEVEQHELNRRIRNALYYEVKEMLRKVNRLSMSIDDLKTIHKILKSATEK